MLQRSNGITRVSISARTCRRLSLLSATHTFTTRLSDEVQAFARNFSHKCFVASRMHHAATKVDQVKIRSLSSNSTNFWTSTQSIIFTATSGTKLPTVSPQVQDRSFTSNTSRQAAEATDENPDESIDATNAHGHENDMSDGSQSSASSVEQHDGESFASAPPTSYNEELKKVHNFKNWTPEQWQMVSDVRTEIVHGDGKQRVISVDGEEWYLISETKANRNTRRVRLRCKTRLERLLESNTTPLDLRDFTRHDILRHYITTWPIMAEDKNRRRLTNYMHDYIKVWTATADELVRPIFDAADFHKANGNIFLTAQVFLQLAENLKFFLSLNINPDKSSYIGDLVLLRGYTCAYRQASAALLAQAALETYMRELTICMNIYPGDKRARLPVPDGLKTTGPKVGPIPSSPQSSTDGSTLPSAKAVSVDKSSKKDSKKAREKTNSNNDPNVEDQINENVASEPVVSVKDKNSKKDSKKTRDKKNLQENLDATKEVDEKVASEPVVRAKDKNLKKGPETSDREDLKDNLGFSEGDEKLTSAPVVDAEEAELLQDPETNSAGKDASSSALEKLHVNDVPHTKLDMQIRLNAFLSAAESRNDRSWWSHELYLDSSGAAVKVHYAKTAESMEDLAKKFTGSPVIGFDMEWVGNSTPHRAISLIQVANADSIGLFHTSKLNTKVKKKDFIVPSLKQIIEDPNVIKTGSNVRGDAQRLSRFLPINPAGVVELSHLHHRISNDPSRLAAISLAKLTKEHLGLPLSKGGVRTSDWTKDLDTQQTKYAAADAYAGFRIFDELNRKRKLITPMPVFPEIFSCTPEVVRGAAAKANVLKSARAEFRQAQIHADIEAGLPNTPETIKVRKPKDMNPELEKAFEWIEEYLKTLESQELDAKSPSDESKPSASASVAQLRCYHLWHVQGFDIEKVAALCRDKPLQLSTVVTSIMEALRLNKLDFKKDALGELASYLPPELAMTRYRGLMKTLTSRSESKLLSALEESES